MSKAKIATNLLDRSVTAAPGLEHVWAKAWVEDFDFTKFQSDPGNFLSRIPKTTSGTPLPGKIVAAWVEDSHVWISVEMTEEPVANEEPNRGGMVKTFLLSQVRLVPQG